MRYQMDVVYLLTSVLMLTEYFDHLPFSSSLPSDVAMMFVIAASVDVTEKTSSLLSLWSRL